MPIATINSLTHHYIDEGPSNAPAIVFQHGAAGSHHQFTEEHTPTIAKKYRCISDDARGLGGSAHVTTMPARAWVDDLLGLLDHLKLDRAHIVGSSRGSRVALRFALEHPDRVKSLVLDGAIIAMTEAGDASLNRRGAEMNAGASGGSQLSPAQQEENRQRHGEDWQDVIRNYFNLRNVPGLQSYLNTRDEVHKITCPVLIMHGDVDDGTHPMASTLELYARLERARLAILPLLPGYSVNRFGGPRFAELILNWVDHFESGKEIGNAFAGFDSCRDSLRELLPNVVAR